MTKSINTLLISLLMIGVFGCQSIPEGVSAISPFSVDNYLGTWYEVARIDNRFEKDLNNTTATYSLKDNGMVKVVNKGFNTKKNDWEDITGKAKFRGSEDVAALSVSFFGPFYAGYNVIALEGDYEYALVAGSDYDYLWILSRKQSIPDNIKKQFLQKAIDAGYDTDDLLWVVHDKE